MTTRILHLTLHRRWFDEIASGLKISEYRDDKPYWRKRIVGREYDEIHFTNGYGETRPFMRIKYHGYRFAPYMIVLKLGEILEIRNYPGANDENRRNQKM